MVTCAEQHGDWIAKLTVAMRQGGRTRVEATEDAETAWAREVADAASASLRSTCNSWYVGSNVPGKARVYIGGFPRFVEACDREAAAGYPSFVFAR